MIYRILFFCLLSHLVLSPVYSRETTGWFQSGKTSKLYVDGIFVFETDKTDKVELPTGLSVSQEIDSYLFICEYFLKKKSKQGVAAVLYQLRLKPQEYRLADALITTLWKKFQNEEQASQKSLQSYIQSEKNAYNKTLARNIYTSLFSNGEDERKSPEKLTCKSELPYYSLCRLFRLQFYLDQTSGKGIAMHKNYVNIIRVVSPFYEEQMLHSIPFLEEIDEELPARLAFLGFANEAINFQRMILEAESASLGGYSENSLERYSFLQVIAGQFLEAEKSLVQLLNISKTKKVSVRNRIYIKLGTLAYLRGNFLDSMNYFFGLDFSDWSSLILHPLLNEPLSIPGAKDLAAVAVWKAKGRDVAVNAIRSIPKGDKVYQEEVWPRLRISQMIMESNSDLSGRITDEISYLAQSRGWKRLEYAATIIQGYNHILNQEFRKSTVEFTKSRGILAAEDQGISSDWLRFSGLVIAHQSSGQKAPVSNFIQISLKLLKVDPPNEQLLTLKNYKPDSFTLDRFMSVSLEHLNELQDAQTIMELIHSYNLASSDLPGIYETGLFQIRAVNNRFKNYSGFQTPRENNYQDSVYTTSRESEVEYLDKEREDIADGFSDEVKNPIIAVLPWKSDLYLFKMNPSLPKKSQWSYKVIEGSNPTSFQAKEVVNQFVAELKNPESIQIYLNSDGLVLYDYLRNMFQNQNFNLFYRFVVSSKYDKLRNLAPIVWASPKSAESNTISSDRSTFEGTKIFREKNRLHIWNYDPSSKGDRLLDMDWSNGEDKESISMKKVIRRIDYRTVPTAMLVSGKTITDSNLKNSKRILDFCSFWLRAGTDAMYLKRDIDLKNSVSRYKDFPIGMSSSKDNDVIIVTRDLK
ncbi:hypothetical protein [Leptospira sp. GIMC2001]|uniref:hypothetical protein n=1 Tax=Leptospira sp. GIMC2001 TaxID=1513297 RepID=UPI0023491753|nr:hypothetical protein [Leptospira sp. GIMC2001]WCL48874.1 hypothetical protein O4O04_16455 [Leptospira sp. GIMC2001]